MKPIWLWGLRHPIGDIKGILLVSQNAISLSLSSFYMERQYANSNPNGFLIPLNGLTTSTVPIGGSTRERITHLIDGLFNCANRPPSYRDGLLSCLAWLLSLVI